MRLLRAIPAGRSRPQLGAQVARLALSQAYARSRRPFQAYVRTSKEGVPHLLQCVALHAIEHNRQALTVKVPNFGLSLVSFFLRTSLILRTFGDLGTKVYTSETSTASRFLARRCRPSRTRRPHLRCCCARWSRTCRSMSRTVGTLQLFFIPMLISPIQVQGLSLSLGSSPSELADSSLGSSGSSSGRLPSQLGQAKPGASRLRGRPG